MSKPKKASARSVLAALIKADMNQAEAGRALGISRQTVAQRIRDNPKLQERIEEFNSLAGEFAVGNVVGAIMGGDVSTSRWYLEKTDERFRPSHNLRLDDDQVDALVKAMPLDQLRKLAGGG